MLGIVTWSNICSETITISCLKLYNCSKKDSPSSSSSCCAASTDLSYPLLEPVSIVHCSREVFKATSCICNKTVILADRPTFARPCEGVYQSMSLMSSSLPLQQCLACLVHLTLIVFVMSGRWPYSCCFVGCFLQDLFNIAQRILV